MAHPLPKVVWLHLPDRIDAAVVSQVCDAIFDRAPSVEILLTQTHAAPVALGHLAQTASLPDESAEPIAAFLKKWSPAVCIWLDGALRPLLLRNCATKGVPLHLVDSGSISLALKGGLIQRLVGNPALRNFLSVAVSDPGQAKAALRSGVAKDRLHQVGMLEPARKCLPVNSGERNHFADLLSTRPIWLAAQINLDEMQSVSAAHAQVLRRAHRLILIVVPANLDDSDAMATFLSEQDANFCRRSLGEEPSSETHIYLADTQEELGLWFRISPLTFIGQTLAGPQDNSPHPFDATALGSAVIHGPQISTHALAYARLTASGASRMVSHSGELAYAVETLMAPDAAAEMVHRAWQVSTTAAQAISHISDMVAQHLPITERPAG